MNDLICPCGSKQPYAKCCGRYLDGTLPAPTAEALMRSRYTAYTQLREDYVLATWHSSTRPQDLHLAQDTSKWIDLEVKRHEQQDADHAIVEFVAKYKSNGRAHRLHEVSNFVREDERWFYVDGDVSEK
ncbi:MAG: YchJ family protein [Gallionellaceae bacterium]